MIVSHAYVFDEFAASRGPQDWVELEHHESTVEVAEAWRYQCKTIIVSDLRVAKTRAYGCGSQAATQGWRDWTNKGFRPNHQTRKHLASQIATIGSPSPKTARFIGSSCGLIDCCGSLSQSMCVMKHTVVHDSSAPCKHIRHRWFAAQFHGLAFHSRHIGQLRVGSRGNDMPSTAQLVDST